MSVKYKGAPSRLVNSFFKDRKREGFWKVLQIVEHLAVSELKSKRSREIAVLSNRHLSSCGFHRIGLSVVTNITKGKIGQGTSIYKAVVCVLCRKILKEVVCKEMQK